MTDIPPQPYIYEGLDAGPDRRRTFSNLSASDVYASLSKVGSSAVEAFENAKRPGMPLSVISNVAREAPLASLLTAFLLGMAIARRR